MFLKHMQSLARWLALTALVACDLTGPSSLRPVTIRFCMDEFNPNWIAYFNEGSGWGSVVINNAPGVPDRTVMAGARTMVAYGENYSSPQGSDINIATINVLYATAEELEAIRCQNEFAGLRTVEGNAVNVPSVPVRVSLSSPEALTAGSTNYFFWNGVPDRIDVIARDAGNHAFHQRAVDLAALPSGAALLVDFQSPLAGPLDSLTLQVAGATEFTTQVKYYTELGSQLVVSSSSGAASTGRIGVIPSSLRGPADMHKLLLRSGAKAWVGFFSGSQAPTAALGPDIAPHSVSTVSSEPLLLRATLPVQPEYPVFARAYFVQDTIYTRQNCVGGLCGAHDTRTIAVAVTAGYLRGAPANWTLEIPDLSQAPGFDASRWGLVPGRATTVCAEAWDMAPRYFFSGRIAPQQPGLTMRGASGSSDGVPCLTLGPIAERR